jgi:spore maturation protein CgeB
MKTVLFVGSHSVGQGSRRRAELMKDRGLDVRLFDIDPIIGRADPLARQLMRLLQTGPIIPAINKALAEAIRSLPPGAGVFLEKPCWVTSRTVELMAERGLRTVCYTPDDPFGPRRDGVWRLFLEALPLYDSHIVPRAVSVDDFKNAGARRVRLKRFGYDARLHKPEQPPRRHFALGYSYIGFPHEQRPAFLAGLKARLEPAGAQVSVMGPGWTLWRHRAKGRLLEAAPPVWDTDYRDAIWNSRASLAFITRLNRDEVSHKAIEIAACGRPPVLEPEGGHAELFEDGVSAIFFKDVEECADKLTFYWDRLEQLESMGQRAARAVAEAGYSEDTLIDLILEELSA